MSEHGSSGRFVSRQRLVAFGKPLKVFLVIGVGRVEGDAGVVGQTLHTERRTVKLVIYQFICHDHNSIEATY